MELATLQERVVFDQPGKWTFLYAWAGPDLWAQVNHPSDYLDIASISVFGQAKVSQRDHVKVSHFFTELSPAMWTT